MKRLVALALLLLVAPLFGLVATPAPVCAMTGSGTLGDPYMIYNATDLQAMENVLTAYYELANDIDCINTTTWNGGAGFAPIGEDGLETVKFRGYFDGNGYTISNLYINRGGEDYVGLFGYLLNADISNVGLHNASVSGGQHTGALVGLAHNSDIDTVTITGSNVYGKDYTGGFVGTAASSNYIEYCSYSGNVTADSVNHIGGFCGWLQSGAGIYRSWSNVIVDALATSDRTTNIGGFIGQMYGSTGTPTVRECFSYGYVEADNYYTYIPYHIGGFIGSLKDGARVYDCGTLAEVFTGEGIRVGGFAGRIESGDCDIYRCYSAGSVFGAGIVGGFLGDDPAGGSSTITACFWDIETSGWPTSGGGEEIGRNTTDMKTETNYTDFSWDFDTIWGIIAIQNVGYPSLLFTYTLHQLVWFQPNAIIEGVVLPNRATNATIDGEIHWGSNPAGIAFEQGLWTPESDYEFAPITAEGPDIIQPDPAAMFTDVDTAGLVNNPLYPMVQALGSLPGLNERLVWLGLAWLAVIVAMLGVHLGFDTKKGTQKPQHFVLTTITGLGLSIFFYVIGIFPLWVVILMTLGLVGAIIWERQPVL